MKRDHMVNSAVRPSKFDCPSWGFEMKVDEIVSVAIVDDSLDSRVGFGYTVEDANLTPRPANGPLGTLDHFLGELAKTDAFLSDFELRTKNYAEFTGAELVARLCKEGTPAVLCTKFEKTQIERIRPFRRWIPVLLKPEDLTPESLVAGFEICIKEMAGEFGVERQPWRTLVRFTEKDPDSEADYFVEVPGWNTQELLRVTIADLPPSIQQLVAPDFRCHVEANLGASSFEDFYLSGWTVP